MINVKNTKKGSFKNCGKSTGETFFMIVKNMVEGIAIYTTMLLSVILSFSLKILKYFDR